MREIKYRNVLKYTEVYPYGEKKKGDISLQYTSVDDLECEDSWQGKRNYAIIERELAIGLKDKKGKELYEGDICVHESRPGAVEGSVVCFDDLSFILKGKTRSDDVYLCRYSWLGIEVIGNIHENPGLLESEVRE